MRGLPQSLTHHCTQLHILVRSYLEDSVGAGNLQILVCDEGDLHLSQAALVARGVNPGQVAEVGVGRAGQDLQDGTYFRLGRKANKMNTIKTLNR